MPDINLVHSSLKNYNAHTGISIQLSLNGFSFCIYSMDDHALRAFRSYTFKDVVLQEDLVKETQKILDRDDLLRLPHQRAQLIYFERKSTLVPNEYGKVEHLKKILQFNHPLDDLDEIHQKSLEPCQSKVIFSIPTYVAGLFTRKFRDIQFYNQSVPFLKAILDKKQHNTAVYLQLNREFVDIAVIINNELQLYNSFLYRGETDLLYYVLYVCKQVSLNPKYVRLLYMGEFAAEKNYEDELLAYLPNARRIENSKEAFQKVWVKIADDFRYFSLFNLFTCE